MARIKINDLPKDMEISKHELKAIRGGGGIVSEMNQLTNMDLQNALQKQQQAIQMLSNMIKTEHDTVNPIIQNLR
jgi:hypothetical protein